MKKFFLLVALIVFVAFSTLSCASPSGYEEGYDDGYSAAKEKFSEHGYEMYQKGYDEATGDFVDGIIEWRAIRYAKENGGWHPEEAMCIIDAYESGSMFYGKTPITEKDYKDAIKTLYYYYEYFYGNHYDSEIGCDFDDYSEPN